MRPLDFLVIGAQKAGTSSLHRYLATNPRIILPANKEAPFFCIDERYRDGWEPFFNRHFPRAGATDIIGKVTTHYMADVRVADRIATLMPAVKLIALLRNPIARAFSSFRMMAMRGEETRTFAAVVEELSAQPPVLGNLMWDASRLGETYLKFGLYGQIVSRYLDRFPREQLLVLFTEDLDRTPQLVIDRIATHIGIERFVPSNLGQRYRVGGSRPKVSMDRLRRLPLVPSIWRRVPAGMRDRTVLWFDLWNTVPDADEARGIDQTLLEPLLRYYEEDVHRLERLIGVTPPWPEFTTQPT